MGAVAAMLAVAVVAGSLLLPLERLPFIEGPRSVYVQSDSTESLLVQASESGAGGSGAGVPPGSENNLGWRECASQWLIVYVQTARRGGEPALREVARKHLEMCPGDFVTIASDFQISVECGDASRREREESC